MQWSTIVATVVGTVLGVISTLAADHTRWRRDISERDRDALRTTFTEYLTTLIQARDAFSRAVPSQDHVGEAHVALMEHGVYSAQQHLALVAERLVVEKASQATNSVLDFHDVVVAGHGMHSEEYVQAWRAVRETRNAMIEEMRRALRRTSRWSRPL